jgi:RNA polymerase sigma factor (sigma-70 family)
MKHAAAEADADIDGIADPHSDPAATADGEADAERLQRLIAALPVAQREALVMKEMAGLSIAEIARITQTSEEGVKSRLRYAMQKLRQAWPPAGTTG